MSFLEEIQRRRTFGIISHPDAGKTTLTEKLLLFGGNSSQGTAPVYNTTFHEMAHASYFKKVGSSYWSRYISYIITYGAYGNGSGRNAGYCGVGEMWGYYMGGKLSEEEFNSVGFYRKDLVSGWIPARIHKRVVEEAGYTIKDIYSSLNSNITTISGLKTEFNSRVGKNIETVNQIFSENGY